MTTQTAEQLAEYLEADAAMIEYGLEAAAMLRSQAAEIERLRSALEMSKDSLSVLLDEVGGCGVGSEKQATWALDAARAALGDGK